MRWRALGREEFSDEALRIVERPFPDVSGNWRAFAEIGHDGAIDTPARLGEHGICVNTLAPGLILSDSILKNDAHLEGASESVLASRAIRRHGHPSDLIGALIFLASSDSDFVTGQTIAVDGGSINT